MTRALAAAGCLLLLAGAGLAARQRPARRTGAAAAVPVPLGLDLAAPVPGDNPLTAAKIELGRRLFSDPILSRDRTMNCSSCHEPERDFTNGRARATGIHGQEGPRNVPSILNAAYGRSFFWDGRAASLEAQALQPIQNPIELDLDLTTLEARLEAREDYRRAFRLAFEDGTPSARNVARAIASYVRTLRAGDAPIDHFLSGDEAALSADARRGFSLFIRRANCSACHVLPLFTDQRFHNTGVSWGTADLGRYAITGRDEDRGAFKVPSLRNVERTAPYMHDGSVATLADVIDRYDRGGTPNPYLDAEIKPLGLSPAEKRELIAFLRSLTTPR